MTEKQPDFMLDLARGCLRLGDQDIELRPKTFEVLRHLADNAGRLVLKQDLYEAVWPDVAVTDDSLVQCVRELREKLRDRDHSLIKTVHRRGYRLDVSIPTCHAAPISPAPTPSAAIADAEFAVQPTSPVFVSQSRLHEANSPISIIAKLLRFAQDRWRLPAMSSAVGVFTAISLGPQATALPERKLPTASVAIPLTVQKFTAGAGHSDLTGLADKITHDLINYLSRVKMLQVSANQGVSRSMSSESDARSNVRYIVHGSTRAQDEKIRLFIAQTGSIRALL